MSKHNVKWIDHGREPQAPTNPQYPDGVAIDMSQGKECCTVELPYPAKRCGYYAVRCTECWTSVAITTAGRPDDPSSVKMKCRPPWERAAARSAGESVPKDDGFTLKQRQAQARRADRGPPITLATKPLKPDDIA